ncbi:hypothetical protein L6452_09698 [Arctium lappa]|uniref:Uncharacterized protein n=1 Tax=Arctium lappa TaxID=4217 RepID=A0ACB9DL75_ARCLA|nr:hypothetical protein L6452_09698 [Arctium lappa]
MELKAGAVDPDAIEGVEDSNREQELKRKRVLPILVVAKVGVAEAGFGAIADPKETKTSNGKEVVAGTDVEKTILEVALVVMVDMTAAVVVAGLCCSPCIGSANRI